MRCEFAGRNLSITSLGLILYREIMVVRNSKYVKKW